MLCGLSVCILIRLNMMTTNGNHTPLTGALLPSSLFHIILVGWNKEEESNVQVSVGAMHVSVWICVDHFEISF